MAYASFMVRLWREEDLALPETATDWQSEVQHIQSGQSWSFSTLDELLDFVRRQAQNPEVLERPARE